MAELADSVLLSRSGVTRLVDRLEREGLLVRDTCDDDGRGLYAVLTRKGEELLERARPTHLAGVRERFLRHFSEAELEHDGRLLGARAPGRRRTDLIRERLRSYTAGTTRSARQSTDPQGGWNMAIVRWEPFAS